MEDIWVESHGLWLPQNNLWHANAWSRTRGKSDQRGIDVQLSLNEWEFFLPGLTRLQHASYCNLIFAFPLKCFTACINPIMLVLNMYVIKSSTTTFKITEELLCAIKLNIQDLLNFEKNDEMEKGRTIKSHKRSGEIMGEQQEHPAPTTLQGIQWSQMETTFNKRKHIFLNIVHSFNHLLTCKMQRSNSYTNLKVIKLKNEVLKNLQKCGSPFGSENL